MERNGEWWPLLIHAQYYFFYQANLIFRRIFCKWCIFNPVWHAWMSRFSPQSSDCGLGRASRPGSPVYFWRGSQVHLCVYSSCLFVSHRLSTACWAMMSSSHLCSLFWCVSVLYFSVHRYEDGSFWPHLKESSSSSVGSGAGQGYNINIPWNKVNNTKSPSNDISMVIRPPVFTYEHAFYVKQLIYRSDFS